MLLFTTIKYYLIVVMRGEFVCITGSFSCFRRTELTGLVKARGGECTPTVTARTTLLLKGHDISDERPSRKLVKARERGIRVLGESAACEQLGLPYQPELPLL